MSKWQRNTTGHTPFYPFKKYCGRRVEWAYSKNKKQSLNNWVYLLFHCLIFIFKTKNTGQHLKDRWLSEKLQNLDLSHISLVFLHDILDKQGHIRIRGSPFLYGSVSHLSKLSHPFSSFLTFTSLIYDFLQVECQ